MITQEELKELLNYDELSGKFQWKLSGKGKNSSLSCGYVDNTGYLIITINRKKYTAQRLAWIYCNGHTNSDAIDHINGDKLDNKISNLRLSNKSQNAWNSKINKNNSSGVKGVHFDLNSKKWIARIKKDKKSIFIGRFSSLEEAKYKIAEARKDLHGEYANHG